MSDRRVNSGAIWLRDDGNDLVVAIERDGVWVEIIRTHAPLDSNSVSYIVEPLGIERCIEEALRREREKAGQLAIAEASSER